MELLVDVDVFERCREMLQRCETVLDSVRNTVLSEQYAMSDRVLRSSGASWQLREVGNRLNNNKNNVRAMRRAMSDICRKYTETENRNKQLAGGVSISDDGVTSDWSTSSSSSGSSSSSDTGADEGFNHLPYLWNLLGEAGLIGSIISNLGSILTGGEVDDNSQHIVDFIEEFGELFGDSDASFSWQELFGLDDYNFADDYNLTFGNGQSVGENVAVGARWAGFILTGIFNGIDNLTGDREGENNTLGRAIAETIGETAVDIGLEVGTAFLASAAAAACGVALPGIVVGGIVVGVGWAADYICETFWGADFSETVSDLVLDTADAIGEFAQGAVETVGDIAEDIGEAIGDAADAVYDTVSGWWNSVFA